MRWPWSKEDEPQERQVEGNGVMKQKEWLLSPVSKLKSKIAGAISIKTGCERERCVVSMEENLFEYLDIIEEDGLLEPRFRGEVMATRPVVIELFLKESPPKYRISGGGSVEVDRIQLPRVKWDVCDSARIVIQASEVEHADFHMSGSASIVCAGEWQAAGLHVSGSSTFEFRGRTGKLNIHASGSAKLDFDEADSVEFDLSGSARLKAKANKSLRGDLSGNGKVCYSGDCKVDIDQAGESKVSRQE